MAFPQFPVGFEYPVITAEQAIARRISSASLYATAAWNDQMARGAAKSRRRRQAALLRAEADLVRVAEQVEAVMAEAA